MSGPPKPPIREALETVQELRERLGLFSFRNEAGRIGSGVETGSLPALDLRPGIIVEWLVTRPGAGALTSTLQILSRCLGGRGAWVVVDPVRESYVPAISGWGLDPARTLLLHPATVQETCWAIEQCLRCPGVSATWAWVEQRLSPTVFIAAGKWRRKSAAAWACFFARMRPTGTLWADLRLLVTPLVGRPGGHQADEDRGAVSPGRPRRQRPGVGDRPCRGSCASGSRGGPSSDCGAQRPELRRSELVLFAGENQRPIDHRLQPEGRTPGRADRSTAGRGQGAVAQGRLPSRR